MCRLICVFVVRIQNKQVFSWYGSYETHLRSERIFLAAAVFDCGVGEDAWPREKLISAPAVFWKEAEASALCRILKLPLSLLKLLFRCKKSEENWTGAWQNQQNDLRVQQRLRSDWALLSNDRSERCRQCGPCSECSVALSYGSVLFA